MNPWRAASAAFPPVAVWAAVAALATVAASMPAAVHAQAIDQVEVLREGTASVMQIRFTEQVQLLRTIGAERSALWTIQYALVSTTNAQLRSSQALRLGARQGLPEAELSDDPEADARRRRLVLRLQGAGEVTVRAGSGGRTIEVVLHGWPRTAAAAPTARAAVPPTWPAAPAAPAVVPVPVPVRPVAPTAPAQSPAAPAVAPASAPASASVSASAPAPATPASGPAPAAAPAAAAPPAPAPAPASPAASSAAETAPPPSPAVTDATAMVLLDAARQALARRAFAQALDAANDLLALPPNRHTREALELAGVARARMGDARRARLEFEAYLRQYASGEGSERVRRELAGLPAATPTAPNAPTASGVGSTASAAGAAGASGAAAPSGVAPGTESATAGAGAPAAAPTRARPAAQTFVSGSAGLTYYGGNGQIRSQEFKDSPLAGLPSTPGEPLLSSDKSSQALGDIDFSWRHRDADQDMRFVLRDTYSADLERSEKSRNRLSSLYFDYKALTSGFGLRAGRQSPQGGGVLGRFDGLAAYVLPYPGFKLSAVGGVPTDKFFESRRRFYGGAIDADSLLPGFGLSLYGIQQTLDAEIDRRAVGLEARYFKDGASLFGQFDHDLLFKQNNITTVQGTWVFTDGSVVNALYDKRALPLLALGNALTFEDPAQPGVRFTRIAERLATISVQALREQVRGTTPFVTQAQLAFTRPLDKTWQLGGGLQLTGTSAIPPVPGVAGYENGQPASENLYSVNVQVVGVNLLSPRDTHVWSGTVINSPTIEGLLLGYNHSSHLGPDWQLEPSLQAYRDKSAAGRNTNERLTPALRITWRGLKPWVMESNLTYEMGRATRRTPDPADPTLFITTRESSRRVSYSLGTRYEF